MEEKRYKHFENSSLPGVVIEVAVGTDYMAPHYAVAVRDFVEGAHEEIGLVVVRDLNVDQD